MTWTEEKDMLKMRQLFLSVTVHRHIFLPEDGKWVQHTRELFTVKPQTVQKSCQVLLPYAGGMNASTGKAWRCWEHWQMQKLSQLPHLAVVPLVARALPSA